LEVRSGGPTLEKIAFDVEDIEAAEMKKCTSCDSQFQVLVQILADEHISLEVKVR